ncbi:MAG: ornithine carbamoyltransferase [Nitriliruptorales bacterium]|nr:ornithine carbamoyltransferase [Nitriliruptorales bacterium]
MDKDFLRMADLGHTELGDLLDLADELKDDRRFRDSTESTRVRHDLHGRTIALVFEKPSTRTRVSFQVAVHELGAHPLPLSSQELQLGRGETIGDTGAVLSRYCHAIVVRTFGQERLDELAAAATVPVVNALTDLEHPCQALADLLTVREEFGELSGRTLTYVGDGNNVANSLLVAGALSGLDVRVAHPDGYAPDSDIVATARDLAQRSGAEVLVTTDVTKAVDGADAIYTDVWTSMGQEAEDDQRHEAFADYQVTDTLFDAAADDAIFLHCLPAHRGEEVTAEVIDGPRSRVWDQAENRLHVQKALLLTLLTA